MSVPEFVQFRVPAGLADEALERLPGTAHFRPALRLRKSEGQAWLEVQFGEGIEDGARRAFVDAMIETWLAALGSTPEDILCAACAYGSAAQVRRILSSGARPSGPWPLISAETAEIAALLLDAGADPNAANPSGFTPLMVASRYSRLEVMKLLIARGAKIDLVNESGTCALFQAMAWKSLEAVKTLVEAGADPNVATPEGWTALMQAASSPLTGIFDYLVEKGARLDARNAEGKTALDVLKSSSPEAYERFVRSRA